MTEAQRQKDHLYNLVNDHWDYIEQMLSVTLPGGNSKYHCLSNEDIRNMCRFHYKSAFEHGWKHAVEYFDSDEYLYDEFGGMRGPVENVNIDELEAMFTDAT